MTYFLPLPSTSFLYEDTCDTTQIVAAGTPAEVLHPDLIRDVFEVTCEVSIHVECISSMVLEK
jgi:ABC-type cobalamin/Fe3+-siderophores transport system ATPase subunit